MKYNVTVTEEKTGAVIFTASGHSVIAGAAIGENASTLFLPSEKDEAAVEALVGACEEAFGSIIGTDEEDDDYE